MWLQREFLRDKGGASSPIVSKGPHKKSHLCGYLRPGRKENNQKGAGECTEQLHCNRCWINRRWLGSHKENCAVWSQVGKFPTPIASRTVYQLFSRSFKQSEHHTHAKVSYFARSRTASVFHPHTSCWLKHLFSSSWVSDPNPRVHYSNSDKQTNIWRW